MIAARSTLTRCLRLGGRRPAARTAALAAFILVVLVAAPEAQQQAAFTETGGRAAEIDTSLPTDIDLLVGRSTVLNVGAPISRVSLTVPDVADALVTAPGQLLIHGKQPGTISLFVWDKSGAIKTYEVNVRRDLNELSAQLRQLFPGELIGVTGSGKDVVLSGTVSSKYVVEKAADVAGGYVEKKEDVVNLLKQQEGVASNQVMLRVRFAEVSRSALQELGASFVANGFKTDWFGRITTQQFPAPDFDSSSPGGLVFSDYLNFFLFNTKEGLGGVVKALQTKGLFQSLAEPNLIATNGKEASFLAGGEYPYPVVQPGGSGTSVTIQFKEFGIRLTFTPTVLAGDLVNLKVRPEVSSLDFANAVTLEGFRVPALSTRRTETEVELRDGQTFAIAGLMNNTVNSTMSKIPGIGDIPVLGMLFRSRAHQKNQTELVVMITPTIIRRGQMGVSEGLPSLVEPYLGRPNKTYPNPDPYLGSPRYPAANPAPDEGNHPVAGPSAAAPAPAMVSPVAAAPAVPAEPPAQTTSVAPEAVNRNAVTPLPAAALTTAPGETTPLAPAAEQAPAAAAPAVTPEQQARIEQAQAQEKKAAEAEARERAEAERKQAEADAAARRKAEAEEAAAAKKAAAEQAAAAKKAAEVKAAAERREAAERKEAEKKAAQAEAEARRKADAERRQAEKLAAERAEREAEVARRNQEIARKQAEADAKREKALTEAAARLKQAQSEYEQELQKARGGADEQAGASEKTGALAAK